MKTEYLDLMEKCFILYGEDTVKRFTEDNYKNGIREHGFPRLSADMAILVANGRQLKYKNDVIKMMDFCCKEMARDCRGGQGNDFSVQELVMAILELEKHGTYPKEITDGFRANLAQIDPLKCYNCIAKDETTFIGNWAVFNALSEWMRVYSGICRREDVIDYIDNQLTCQFQAIDENFMYRDPHEPMVYDLVPRRLFAVMIYFGYDGRYRDKLIEIVEKTAILTLEMQSVTGELPFGGRSNQFMHNEAWISGIMEFYAVHFAKKGDLKLAGMCKSSARLARESMNEWFDRTPGRHLKNRFTPGNSMYGCEKYAYFDKYMITTASLCYQSYMLADDSIPEVPCPAENGRGILKLSKHFHKVFMHHGDYQLEFELNADRHYDGSGLGRVHKKGVPGPICLSVPFPGKEANYIIDNLQDAMALCGFANGEGRAKNASYVKGGYRLIDENDNGYSLSITLEAPLSDDFTLTEKYTLTNDGVEICVSGNGWVGYNIPVFNFDGTKYTDVTCSPDGRTLTVSYEGHKCVYFSENAVFVDNGKILANRNGHYRHYTVSTVGKLNIKISLK